MAPPIDERSTTLVLRLAMPLFSLYSLPDLLDVVKALGAGMVTNDTWSSSMRS